MVDQTKRTTLKFLGGSAVIATASPLAMAGNCFDGTDGEAHAAMEDIIVPITTGTELTISLSIEPEPTVRITNHSSKLVIVRHVYPGIVQAGAQTFDINSIFANSAYAISAGKSRNVLIMPTSSTATEKKFPKHSYNNSKPMRLVAVTGRDQNGRLANSSRSFFA